MKSLIDFLAHSPTAWHAAETIASHCTQAGFTLLHEDLPWKLQPGHSYFLLRDGAPLAAFRLPRTQLRKSLLLASHLDSPALKLKPRPERSSHSIAQFSTEVYGSPLLHSWLDRELALAGRVVTLSNTGSLQTNLLFLPHKPLIIPQLAPHLDRSMQEKGLVIHRQEHLHAIASLGTPSVSLEALCKEVFSFDQLLSFDLFLVPIQPAQTLGFQQEFLAGYRLDNLTSAYASLQALLAAPILEETLSMAIFWDHEEIGSQSCLGADSLFVDALLERILHCFALSRDEFYQIKSRSLTLSVDLAHGFHPNYADRYDPTNAPFLGQGVVLKQNANQRYATSAPSQARLLHLAAKAHIPMQTFASRSDIPSGSTVGPIMAARTGIATLDLGIAGWAMHSTREVIACEDQRSLTTLLQRFLETE